MRILQHAQPKNGPPPNVQIIARASVLPEHQKYRLGYFLGFWAIILPTLGAQVHHPYIAHYGSFHFLFHYPYITYITIRVKNRPSYILRHHHLVGKQAHHTDSSRRALLEGDLVRNPDQGLGLGILSALKSLNP